MKHLFKLSIIWILIFFGTYGKAENPGDHKTYLNINHSLAAITKENNNPVILSSMVVDSDVEQYGKFECIIELEASYDNPYNYDEILVSAVFTSPSGQKKTIDGFFMKSFELNQMNGAITPTDEGQFKIRFSPNELGKWYFQVSLRDMVGTTSFEEQSFNCVLVESPNNKGFVRVGQTNYLKFDNEEQLILIGENMAWENTNPFMDYKNWLDKLSEKGGNYFRLWHAHWGLGIEWKSGWQDYEGLRRYNEANCFYQDWLYDFCAEKGIYVMLALQHHGQVSTQVNPNWNDSPYNVANGGPCQNTLEFFTKEEAIAHTKNRYRYIIARWGYARSIMSWELFNEVDWTDDYASYRFKVRDWHTEMAAYLKTIDPYQHLVTTSYAHSDQDPEIWSNPDFDFTQTHYYINTSNMERALVSGIREYLEEYEKPTLTGEFGMGSTPELSNSDPDGIHIHNGMWGALFGGGMGTAMSWWWDLYMHPKNLYYHFAPIAAVVEDVPFEKENLAPAFSYVIGAPGDLVMTPNLGWGVIGDEEILIQENGNTIPANAGLGQFLYGSEWNTEFRSPPSFTISYPSDGEFNVRTNTITGENPKISIYLDGNLELNEDAAPNQIYSINVPAGQHIIKVDNLGTDWITIGSYTFTGAGSKVDSYSLLSENKEVVAGWILNHEYNHQYIEENGIPDPIISSELVVEGLNDGDYFLKWYDCISGEVVGVEPVTSINQQIFLPIPEMQWDLAFRVDKEELVLGTKNYAAILDFEVFPNPIQSGDNLNLDLESDLRSSYKINILDASGRYLLGKESTDRTLHLPTSLSAGAYWVMVNSSDGKSGKRLIFVN